MLGIDLGPHDPTVWGWLIVGVYLLAAAFSLIAGRALRRGPPGPLRIEWFWYASALVLLALAINKQLDLQTGFNRLGTRAVADLGWYGQRQVLQTWATRGVVVGGLFVVAALAVAYRRASIQHWLAIAGLAGLLGFIAIRAISLHDVDLFLFDRLGADLTASRALELGGALVIAAAAVWAALAPPSTPRRREPRRPASELRKAHARR